MSRVFRALEKAEEEKKKKGGIDPFQKSFEEKVIGKKETPVLRFPEERMEGLELSIRETAPILVAPQNSFSEEEFRKLKAQIFLRFPNPPNTILITSTFPQEGKTLVAVNLAMAISKEIHKKAILIDGDLRKPGLHIEKRKSSKGLSNYLSDGIQLSEILIDSEMENLRVIPAGPSTHRASELIGSKRMVELLKSLKESEDNAYLIIDSSPIISTTEPTLLSEMVDGILLVVLADRTPRESIQKAVKSINRQKIIGIVFNQIEIKQSNYYSKYYYKYYRK